MGTQNRVISTLSVIVPVARMSGRLLNLSKWLQELELILITTDIPCEIILIHDIQDENTSGELKLLINKFSKIKIIFNEGFYGSPGLARNAGIEIASGEWLTFWDSDDIPQVEDFYLMVQVADGSKSECAVGGFTAIHETTRESKSHLLSKNYLKEIAINPGIWRFAFKRNELKGLWFSSLLMAEDQIFLANFNIPDRRIEIFSKSVYNYFIGENFHLTKNKESLKDLPRAIIHSFSLIRDLTNENISFVSILLSRQLITALRTSKYSERLEVIRILFQGLSYAGKRGRKEILFSLWYVFWNRQSIL